MKASPMLAQWSTQSTTSSSPRRIKKLFDYIRSNILDNPRLVRFTEITQQMVLFMQELGTKEIRESTETHPRRKIEMDLSPWFSLKIYLETTVCLLSLKTYREFS